MDDAPETVFIHGIPRSGSTLLSILLGKHPEFHVPPEPWLMLALAEIGRAAPTAAADPRLIAGATYELLDADDRVFGARAYYQAVARRKLAAAGRRVFVDKTPRNHMVLELIDRAFPEARSIVLKRNPLDIATSLKTTWGIDLGKLLLSESDNRFCIDYVHGLRRLVRYARDHDRCLAVRYEDLVASPESAMQEMFEFLDHPVGRFDCGFNAAEILGTSWFGDKKILDTSSPHAKSVNTWHGAWSDEELQVLSDAIGEELFVALGYGDTIVELAKRGLRFGAGRSGPFVAATEAAMERFDTAGKTLDCCFSSLAYPPPPGLDAGLAGSGPAESGPAASGPAASGGVAAQVHHLERQLAITESEKGTAYSRLAKLRERADQMSAELLALRTRAVEAERLLALRTREAEAERLLAEQARHAGAEQEIAALRRRLRSYAVERARQTMVAQATRAELAEAKAEREQPREKLAATEEWVRSLQHKIGTLTSQLDRAAMEAKMNMSHIATLSREKRLLERKVESFREAAAAQVEVRKSFEKVIGDLNENMRAIGRHLIG